MNSRKILLAAEAIGQLKVEQSKRDAPEGKQ